MKPVDSSLRTKTSPSRQRGSARCGTRGFTFGEVMVAAALLGVAMAAFFQVTSMTRRSRKNAHNHFVAVTMANNRIERAKHMRLSELPLLRESDVQVNSLGSPDPDGTFLRSTTIETNQNEDAHLVRITVTVQPPLLRANTQDPRPSESVSTLLTEYLDP